MVVNMNITKEQLIQILDKQIKNEQLLAKLDKILGSELRINCDINDANYEIFELVLSIIEFPEDTQNEYYNFIEQTQIKEIDAKYFCRDYFLEIFYNITTNIDKFNNFNTSEFIDDLLLYKEKFILGEHIDDYLDKKYMV